MLVCKLSVGNLHHFDKHSICILSGICHQVIGGKGTKLLETLTAPTVLLEQLG